jgi:uncharacterized protein YabN with tetrapyrrole methylase and pyrophosphatase domain
MRGPTQITPECRSAIVASDIVFYVVPDRLTAHMIEGLAAESVDLGTLYSPEQDRALTYESMVDRVFEDIDTDRDVCVVFYGHPGVFVDPGPAMMRRAQDLHVQTLMLPGISAADALYADLGLDPGREGVQMFSATDFLLRPRTIDTSVPLILWQMGAIGQDNGASDAERRFLPVLASRLSEMYPHGHEVTMYEASGIVGFAPNVHISTIEALPDAPLSRATTMLVPPTHTLEVDDDMRVRLGLADP